MRVYILAGGLGTRFAEMTDQLPKPMIPIGDYPILLHIMSHYDFYGIKDFVILGGYKVEVIKGYFEKGVGLEISKKNSWNVNVIDTGLNNSTAGRIHRVKDSLPETFMLTYGDGVSNVNIKDLANTHLKCNLALTVTAVRPPARFGSIDFQGNIVTSFKEKDPQKTGWINGGFFCANKNIVNFIVNPSLSFESQTMEKIVEAQQLAVYPHESFWHPMDTLRDQMSLQEIFNANQATWKIEALYK